MEWYANKDAFKGSLRASAGLSVEQPLPVCERVEGLGSAALAIGAGAAFAFAYLDFQDLWLCSVFSSET